MKTDKSIRELIDEFVGYKDITRDAREKCRGNLHAFFTWMTRRADPMKPARGDVMAYKNHLLESGHAVTTTENYLSAVRQFFKYLEENGIHEDVASGIRCKGRYYGHRKGYLQPDQVKNLLSYIDQSSMVGARDYAIINLMVRMGLRCCEVSRMNTGDLTKNNNEWILAIQGKGHHEKDCDMGIPDKAVAPMLSYLERSRHAIEDPLCINEARDPFFHNHANGSNGTRITTLTLSKMIKSRLRAAGIDSPKLTAHSLRHTAAISLIKSGASLNEVQSIMRHKSIEYTQIYLSAIEEENRRSGTTIRRLDDLFD